MIQHVLNDHLVIADLTGQNPNVFYELALRHIERKPVIQLIEADEIIPFDVRGVRTITIDHHDLDSVETARSEIIDSLGWIDAHPGEIETPVSVAVGIQRLRESKNPIDRGNAQILDELAAISRQLSKLRVESCKKDSELKVHTLRGAAPVEARMNGMWRVTRLAG